MAQTHSIPAPASPVWSTFLHRAQTAETTLRFVVEQWQRFKEWRQRRAAFAELRALDDVMLKDIGLHRSQIGSLLLDDEGRSVNAKQRLRFGR